MKYFFSLLFIFYSFVNGQYQLKSKYLINPELSIDFVDSCANFWTKAWDNSIGGFYTNVAKNGDILYSWGSNKDMLSQSRNAYGFVRAFMLTGNEEYLSYANSALQFMYKNSWDKNFGGWINGLSNTGKPNNPTENKTAFYQHYAMLGISSYFEATRDTSTWNWLIKSYMNNESKLWDKNSVNFGYYDYANYNWTNKFNKSFNATVDAITTHILYLYLITDDESYKQKLINLADNMKRHLMASMQSQKIGFAEKYNSNWQILPNETLTIMGHLLKTSWCFARIYQLIDSVDYLDNATLLFNHVVEKGYDNKYGGPYKDYNRITGQMQMWGNPDTAKAWWQMEQAVVAGLQLFDLTKDEKYLSIADETLDFFMRYFVDHVYGEVYENRTRRGGETWGEHKGNGAKAAYHSIELGYYNYIYANLFVHKKPITLHYFITPVNYDRNLDLTPLAISEGKLRISSVKCDGYDFTSFDGCKINLSCNIGGKFEVTYEISEPQYLDNFQGPNSSELSISNYPNPFNASTILNYKIPKSGNVRVDIYNSLGQKIETLENSIKQKGSYLINFDGSLLSSGIYYCRIMFENSSKVNKILLLK